MALKIRKACVLGAGVMGAQIAAHLAAAGVRTHLLDLATDDIPTDPKLKKLVGKNTRSTRAIMAIEGLKSLKPSPLMTNSVLKSIIPGNFDDDMSVISECDWVVEAVVERMDIKEKIHKQIAEFARGDIPITTNTSGISVADMAKNFPEHLAKNFFGTHFFNPPRYLHLVEIISHENTDQSLTQDLSNWIGERLGKGIVVANDTTNFIANRIGVFNLQATIKHMEEFGLNIETVDALTGKLMGRPASATFRTLDVVGLDTYAHTTSNVHEHAPSDPYRATFLPSKWISALIEKGSLGQKTGGIGCYKKSNSPDGRRLILAYRPEDNTYAAQEVDNVSWLKEASKIPSTIDRLKFVFGQDDQHAKFVWSVLRDTMNYAATVVDEIASGNIKSVDEAIRWGFSWEWGPLELWQGIGFDDLRTKMVADGVSIAAWCKEGTKFYRPEPGSMEWHVRGADYVFDNETGKNRPVEKLPNEFFLPKFRTEGDERIAFQNNSLSLVDIGNGVACLTFHSKMNTINDEIVNGTQEAISKVSENFEGMVIGNEGAAFSAGADLRNFVGFIDKKDWNGIDQMLRQFQGTMQMIKFAPFPTVAAPHGLTLGGGCEVSLHTSQQVIAAETYAGLVEIGVGLIPAGGGTKELALRAYNAVKKSDKGDPMPFLQNAFQLIGMGKVSTSGPDAVAMGLYPDDALISISREHQIQRAKIATRYLIDMGYSAPLPATNIKAVGDPGIQTFKLGLYNMAQGGFITEYEAVIAEKIVTVLCGGPVAGGTPIDEQYLLDLERNVFVELCQQPKTRERIENMLKTGRPLRN